MVDQPTDRTRQPRRPVVPGRRVRPGTARARWRRRSGSRPRSARTPSPAPRPRRGRDELAALFAGVDPATDAPGARRLGAFHQALLAGVMTQWLVDPDEAPSARELAEALRAAAQW